jgi:hypothetical protein
MKGRLRGNSSQTTKATAVERGLTVTIELTTSSRRDLDALVYFLNSHLWQKRVTLKSGRQVYGLPSRTSAGLFHLTDGSECSCKDWTSRQPDGGCAHMRAAVLYRMERKAEEAKDRKSRQVPGAQHKVTASSFAPCSCGALISPEDRRISQICQECQGEQAMSKYAALFGQEDDKPWCAECNRHHTPGEHYTSMAS